MPNNTVKAVADKLKAPMSDIEDKWAKAEEIAKKKMESENSRNKGYKAINDDSYYPYVMGIFKNMFKSDDRKQLALESLMSAYTAIFESYSVPHINGKTLTTDVNPESRSLKNLPRYANGKARVKFQDWLDIKKPSEHKGISGFNYSWGKGSDGRYYGWSHRAVASFGVGDTVDPDTCGNINGNKQWKIATELEAIKQAIAFANDIS